MQRLGLNHGRYNGEQIDIGRVLSRLLSVAPRFGWELDSVTVPPGEQLHFLRRAAVPSAAGSQSARNIYISTGIHGDEPAGPLALMTLVCENRWPANLGLWICPCLNPTGFPRNSRENSAGIDLNRDYRTPRSAEVRAHVDWLSKQPAFDLTLCLHEDWEAGGFYCYEVNPDNLPSLSERIVNAAARVCPIETATVIDGREADSPGIIRPRIDPHLRPEWPEALSLVQTHTRLSYTLEAPSDFPLAMRVAALVEAVRAAITTG